MGTAALPLRSGEMHKTSASFGIGLDASKYNSQLYNNAFTYAAISQI